MQSIGNNDLLRITPDAIQSIKKIHGLDKPGRLADAIKILEEWIQKQDHIVKKDFSKGFLERTLICCKGSVEKSKKQIDSLCTMKTLLPKFFTKTNLKMELKSILDIVSMVPLPILTKDFYRSFIVHVNDKKFNSESYMEYFQYTIILTEYIRANDYCNGYILIYDYTKANIKDFIAKLNPVELQQFLSIAIEGYGGRLKAIHIITESTAIDLLVKIIKQVVSKKIGNRIHVHPTLEDLRKVVPEDILPLEYGGKERSIHIIQNEWIEELSSEKHVEYMKMMREARTDESRRVASKFNEDYMGMPGSFRNLSVD